MKKTKTLKNIQTFATVFQVLYTIGFVGCLIGVIGCGIALAATAMGVTEAFTINGVTIHGLLETYTDGIMGVTIASVTAALIVLLFDMALCKMGVNYFKHEKKAGTPFTFEGSKELFRLGIMTIVLPLVGSMVASIVSEIINNLGKGNFNFDIDAHSSIGFGLALMAVSLVCKYGAEISSDNEYDGESYYDDDDDEDEAL